jgi:glutathione S-transferase
MFTRKLEAQLRYQKIPYEWQIKSRDQTADIEAKGGTRFIPLLATPDSWLISDTISIGPMLHHRFNKVPVIPQGPAQRGICFILEDFFNHWYPRHALHSRWCYPENVKVVGDYFGANVLLGKSLHDELSPEEREEIAGFGDKMLEMFGAMACEVQGAGPDKKAEVQKDFGEMMDILNVHFTQHDFLLGGRACLADFALVGPVVAHFLLDPEPKSWLGDKLAMIEAYVDRVWNSENDDGDWLAGDEIPETLLPLLAHAENKYAVFALSSIQAAARGDKYFEVDLGDGPFTARAMKRLDKSRLHVQDEILSCRAEQSAIKELGILDFYLQPPIV